MADDRTYIKVHDGMPDHPKVEPLSDAAFRLLVTVWCWCSRHLTDGHVPEAIWTKRGTAKSRRELIAAGLAAPAEDGVQMHDYLEHQRSAATVAERKEAKSAAGHLGNHRRWHEGRGVVDAGCPHCVSPNGTGPATTPPSDPNGIADTSQDRSHVRSQERSQTDRKTSLEVEVEVEKEQITEECGSLTSVDAGGARAGRPPPHPSDERHEHSAAGDLAAYFAERMPLTDHGKAMRVIARAIEAGYPPDMIRNGLGQLADTGRVCTLDTLRLAMTGAADNWRPANGPSPGRGKPGSPYLDDLRAVHGSDAVSAAVAAMCDAAEADNAQPAPLRALPGGAA
jgi:hypothetical protein